MTPKRLAPEPVLTSLRLWATCCWGTLLSDPSRQHVVTPAPYFSQYNPPSFQNVSKMRSVGLRINRSIQNRMMYKQTIFIKLIWVPLHPYIVWTGPAASYHSFHFILLQLLLSGKKFGKVWQASKKKKQAEMYAPANEPARQSVSWQNGKMHCTPAHQHLYLTAVPTLHHPEGRVHRLFFLFSCPEG